MSDVYNRDPENDLTYNSGTGSYVLTSSLLNPDPIDESTTVKELAVNSTVYDIVGKGILDQNSKTTQIEWVGTKAEYDALGVYADHCTYIITDDSADSRVDEVGAIAEEVNTLKSYDYVVDWQIPTSANGYMWYRKYKSGWVEQGVAQRITGGGNVDVVLPVPMTDANYTILISQNNSDGTGTYFQCQYHTPTATGFKVISQYGQSRTSRPFLWYVCGMAA